MGAHLLVLLLVSIAITQMLSLYALLKIGADIGHIFSELMSIGVAVEDIAYVEDDGAPGMIERLDDWLIQQESDRIVADILANAHIVEEETDGGTSWGRVE